MIHIFVSATVGAVFLTHSQLASHKTTIANAPHTYAEGGILSALRISDHVPVMRDWRGTRPVQLGWLRSW